MRGIRERRYLTERYQQKQVRLAYTVMYDKPYDRERYIRTEFSRKRRFYDILRGNYVEWRHRWAEDSALNSNGYERHEFTRAELGRFRTTSFDHCSIRHCRTCSNPRKGYGWEGTREKLTMQEKIALLHLEEELDFYKQGERYETLDRYSARR